LVETFGWDYLTSTALHEFTNKCACVLIDERIDIVCIILLGVFTFWEKPSVCARTVSHLNMVWFFEKLVPFVGTDLKAGFCYTMVGSFQTNNACFLGMNFCHL
jgi:hypothetical protein